MILADQMVAALLAVCLVAIVGLTVTVAVVARRLRTLRRAYASALDPSRGEDVFQAVQRQAHDLDGLRRDVGVIDGNTQHLRELLSRAISRVAIVRYDAFEDMGGALSFSAALLDDEGTGVIVSAINGRSETRCYGKPVIAGHSEHNLSREEHAAIEAARARQTEQVLTTPRRRRAS